MRTIVHVSDLHFGRVDASILRPLLDAVVAARPDVVAVSGDLTQRARRSQFRDARAFLEYLPKPQVIVPGNHDVPLYDVVRRFLAPLARYRRYITDDLAPFYLDDEIAVVGLNTARSLTFKNGRVNRAQVELVASRLVGLDPQITRVVVTHHPFDLPPQGDEKDVLGRAAMAMEAFARCGVDLLLSGHLHRSHAASSASRYRIDGYAALVVQAGTASSTRGRGEANAFNVIRIDDPEIAIATCTWSPEAGAFLESPPRRFRRSADTWEQA